MGLVVYWLDPNNDLDVLRFRVGGLLDFVQCEWGGRRRGLVEVELMLGEGGREGDDLNSGVRVMCVVVLL